VVSRREQVPLLHMPTATRERLQAATICAPMRSAPARTLFNSRYQYSMRNRINRLFVGVDSYGGVVEMCRRRGCEPDEVAEGLREKSSAVEEVMGLLSSWALPAPGVQRRKSSQSAPSDPARGTQRFRCASRLAFQILPWPQPAAHTESARYALRCHRTRSAVTSPIGLHDPAPPSGRWSPTINVRLRRPSPAQGLDLPSVHAPPRAPSQPYPPRAACLQVGFAADTEVATDCAGRDRLRQTPQLRRTRALCSVIAGFARRARGVLSGRG